MHVTIRVREDVPSLRSRRFLSAFRDSLVRVLVRDDFRVVHYAFLRDHVHMIVEADSNEALAAGMKSVGARLARAANRVFGRKGAVLDGRFHSETLGSPRRVRNAIRYVLLNARKHQAQRGGRVVRARGPDEASSGRWFEHWREGTLESRRARRRREVARARTWLLAQGWLRHGRFSWSDVPGPAGERAS